MKSSQPIDILHLKQIQAAFEAGHQRCAAEYGITKPYMSLTEAYKSYGRGTVDRWIAEGLIRPVKDGTGTSKRRISRAEIIAVAFTSNRGSYFDHF